MGIDEKLMYGPNFDSKKQRRERRMGGSLKPKKIGALAAISQSTNTRICDSRRSETNSFVIQNATSQDNPKRNKPLRMVRLVIALNR